MSIRIFLVLSITVFHLFGPAHAVPAAPTTKAIYESDGVGQYALAPRPAPTLFAVPTAREGAVQVKSATSNIGELGFGIQFQAVSVGDAYALFAGALGTGFASPVGLTGPHRLVMTAETGVGVAGTLTMWINDLNMGGVGLGSMHFDSSGSGPWTFEANVPSGITSISSVAARMTFEAGTQSGANFYVSGVNLEPGLVTAVPEPASWAMMVMGLMGVSAAAQRRRI